jgi:hypothetical protein
MMGLLNVAVQSLLCTANSPMLAVTVSKLEIYQMLYVQ